MNILGFGRVMVKKKRQVSLERQMNDFKKSEERYIHQNDHGNHEHNERRSQN